MTISFTFDIRCIKRLRAIDRAEFKRFHTHQHTHTRAFIRKTCSCGIIATHEHSEWIQISNDLLNHSKYETNICEYVHKFSNRFQCSSKRSQMQKYVPSVSISIFQAQVKTVFPFWKWFRFFSLSLCPFSVAVITTLYNWRWEETGSPVRCYKRKMAKTCIHISTDAANELKNRDSMVLKFNETENNFIKYQHNTQEMANQKQKLLPSHFR